MKDLVARLISGLIPIKKYRHILRKRLSGKLTHYEYVHRNYRIGRNSYISGEPHIVDKDGTIIGKFCSISTGVHIGTSQNPLDRISTSPFTYYNDVKHTCCEILVPESKLRPFSSVKPVTIGNDVWIGRNAIIMDGVTIGDGAVIGSAAVVTHDIPPYAICVGVPAKVIRYRFDDKTISRLLRCRWWDFPEDFIANQLEFDNLEKCLQVLEANMHLLEPCHEVR